MKSIAPSTQEHFDDESSQDDGAFMRTLRFTYHHSAELAALSIAWTVLSLPLITIGPVTLGSYRAIGSLRETGSIELAEVRSTVREQLLASLMLGLVPLMFGAIGVLYITTSPGHQTLSVALGVVALYIAIYFWVLLVPTFYRMADGADPIEALRTGYLCIAGDPITAVRLIIVTTGLLIVSTLLTIALVLIFPAVTMTYHIYLIEQRLVESSDV